MPPLIMPKSKHTFGVTPPPPGVTPNFDHPVSRGTPIIVVNVIFVLLSTLILFLRLYTRWLVVHIMNGSDYVIIIGQLFGIGYSAITILLVRDHGVAVHAWDIPLTQVGHILKLSLLQAAFLWPAIMCAKVSILLLYLRLSPYKYFRAITYGLMVIAIIYGFLGSFEFLFACQPIAKYWDPTITYGSCMDRSKYWMSNAAVNSVTDIIMMFLPIFMLWHLRIPKRQKIGLVAIFMTGIFVCATSLIRLSYQIVLSRATDVAWKAFATAIWGTVELFVGLICASLPHAKPFLRRHFPKVLGSTGHPENLTEWWTNTSQAAPATLPPNNEDDAWLYGGGNSSNGGISLPPLNSALKSSKTDFVSRVRRAAKGDKHVTVTIHAGKATSQKDGDSQRAILEAEATEPTSDVNGEEEYPHHQNSSVGLLMNSDNSLMKWVGDPLASYTSDCR